MPSGIGIIFSILWILFLWFIGWPIASFVAFFYILLLPCAPCIPALQLVTSFLLRIVKLPYQVGVWIKDGKDCSSLSLPKD